MLETPSQHEITVCIYNVFQKSMFMVFIDNRALTCYTIISYENLIQRIIQDGDLYKLRK